MHAYLLVGSNIEKLDQEIEKLGESLSAKILEFPGQKIGEIRKLNSFVSLTLQEKTAILIKNIDKSTTEALNAFLKNLEEPQKNLFYILTTSSIHKVLPTIISRCQTILIPCKQRLIDKDLYERFIKMKTSQKLSFFDKMRQRNEAIIFFNNLINFLHEKIVKGEKDYTFLANITEFSEETLIRLELNGNVSLQLVNFAVNTDRFDTSTL